MSDCEDFEKEALKRFEINIQSSRDVFLASKQRSQTSKGNAYEVIPEVVKLCRGSQR